MPKQSSSVNRLELGYLRAFEAVARLGHVGAAARELNLTPGAVSQQLRKLQSSLAVDLFERDGRRIRLSPKGSELHRTVTAALDDIGSCVNDLAVKPDGEQADSIRLSVPPALGVAWLSSLMFDFCQSFGLTSFKMTAAIDVAQVDWRQTDVAITYGAPPKEGFAWRYIATVKLRPICSPALLNSADGLRSLADIVDQWLLHEDDGTEWRRWLSAAKIRRVPRRNAYYSTLMMAIAAAIEGRGLALVSDLLAQDYLKSGRLVRPYDIGVEATRSYYCICPENRAGEPLIERFMDWITSTSQVEYALRGQPQDS
jgi:LysR family glycine cleavage system transcriptional activator